MKIYQTILIILLSSIISFGQADTKVSDLTNLATPATGDLFFVVDVSDTTDDPAGSGRNMTIADFLAFAFANPVFTGAATFGTGSGQIDFGTTSVRITGDGDGAITLLGLGDGSDEDLTINLDDTANTIGWSSSTGVTVFDFGAIGLDLDSSSLKIPAVAGSSTLAAGGAVALNTTAKNIGVHNGAKEVAIPLVYSKEISFDPKAVCDGAVDRLFLFKIGTWAPNGITITGWRASFEADPITEVDLDLKRADAFIGVANSAVMDVLDTTAGASAETTAANINGGAVVANGKVVYLEFGTAYTETTHQIIFELEYEVEED